MATALEPTKTKIAKRVIEVFEYFDESHRRATVMDIARRFGWPQSSTSELLACLVEMGFLYKDAYSRSYMPTPRIALLGSAAQPKLLHNGRLLPLMDQLASTLRLGVGLMGTVGANVQIFHWISRDDRASEHYVDLGSGLAAPLTRSVGGLMLLSAHGPLHQGAVMRRLNAEAPPEGRVIVKDAQDRILMFQRQRCAIGESGFGVDADMCAVLIPNMPSERQLAIGVVYHRDSGQDTAAIADVLKEAVARFARAPAENESYVRPPQLADLTTAAA